MSFLFIGSTGNHAGRSLTTWAIARKLIEKGLNVGFLKPFGSKPILSNDGWTDSDAVLFKQVLNLEGPMEKICPYPLAEEALLEKGPEEILEEFQILAHELGAVHDIVIIMGARHIFFDNTAFPVHDINLSMGIMADFILVDRYKDISRSIYSILSVRSLLNERIKGVILNRIPLKKIAEVRDRIKPYISSKGMPLTAIIPEEPSLTFRSLEEIREILDGKFLCGEEKLQQPVGAMTTGTSDLKGNLKLFKRVYNKIILLSPRSRNTETEGSGAGVAVAAVVLTGGRKPAFQVLETAKKAGISLILVNEDTFSALERLEQTPSTLSSEDNVKVERFIGLFDHEGALDRLLDSL
ncbi:AAA family ATPase [Thermodesulfobacteriota bacterium]